MSKQTKLENATIAVSDLIKEIDDPAVFSRRVRALVELQEAQRILAINEPHDQPLASGDGWVVANV